MNTSTEVLRTKKIVLLSLIFIIALVLVQCTFVQKGLNYESWGHPFSTFTSSNFDIKRQILPAGAFELEYSSLPIKPPSPEYEVLFFPSGLFGNILFWTSMFFFCCLFFTAPDDKKRIVLLEEMGRMFVGLPFFFLAILTPIYLLAMLSGQIGVIGLLLVIPILVSACLLTPFHLFSKKDSRTAVKYFLIITVGIFILGCLLFPVFYVAPYPIVTAVIWPILFLIKIQRFGIKSDEVPAIKPITKYLLPVGLVGLLLVISAITVGIVRFLEMLSDL